MKAMVWDLLALAMLLTGHCGVGAHRVSKVGGPQMALDFI